jgi:hypothetical protein
LAQTVYDLNEYIEDPTEADEKNFLIDLTGGSLGCALFLVAM